MDTDDKGNAKGGAQSNLDDESTNQNGKEPQNYLSVAAAND